MTITLAMDTSTAAVTAALIADGNVLAASTQIDARRHTEILMPLIDELFTRSGVDRGQLTSLAVGVGPGPFTGLRVGITTAATLSLVLQIPAVGVCSLDAIAHEVLSGSDAPADFVVASDARRKEMYWARYSRGERVGEPDVCKPADLPGEVRALPAAGRGAALYPKTFAAQLPVLDVAAAHLGLLADSRPDLRLPLQPMYLRQPDAVPSAGQKSVLSAGPRRRDKDGA